MKTKIKRHSRAVISVILAISMLVSCMMVGLIATDAAKVTDSAVGAKTDNTEETVGAKTDDTEETVGAKDDSEDVGAEGDWYIVGNVAGVSNWSERDEVKLSAVTGGYSISVKLTKNSDFRLRHNSLDYGAASSSDSDRKVDSSSTDKTLSQSNQTFIWNGETGTYTVTVNSAGTTISFGSGGSGTSETWTIAGTVIFGNDWDKGNTANDMTLTDTNTYTKSYTVNSTAGFQFKIVKNHVWGEEYPSSNFTVTHVDDTSKRSITASGNLYWKSGDTITFTFNSSTHDISVTSVTPETTHDVTFSAETGGTTSPSGTVAVGESTETTITATPEAGYQFSGWIFGNGITYDSDSDASTTITTKGSGTYTVHANFTKKPTHKVTVVSNNNALGTATASVTEAYEGQEVSLTPHEDTGSFSSWSVTSGGVSVSNNKFTMSSSDVAITATFEEYSGTSDFYYNSYGSNGQPASSRYGAQMTEAKIGGQTYSYYQVTGRTEADQLFTISYGSPKYNSFNTYFSIYSSWESKGVKALFYASDGKNLGDWQDMTYDGADSTDKKKFRISIPDGARSVRFKNGAGSDETDELFFSSGNNAWYHSGSGFKDVTGYNSDNPVPLNFWENFNSTKYTNAFDSKGFDNHNADRGESHAYTKPKDLGSFSSDYYVLVLYKDKTYTINGVTKKITNNPEIIWLPELPDSGDTIKVYAKDGAIRSDSSGATYANIADTKIYAADGTTTVGTKHNGSITNQTYETYKVDKGDTIVIKTTIGATDSSTLSNAADLKAKYYVRGFCVNGEVSELLEWNADGVYTLTYKVPEDYEGKNIEITPIYYLKDTEVYPIVTYRVTGFTDELKAVGSGKPGWGDTLYTYPFYGKLGGQNNAFGAYPGQPMVYYKGQYQMQIPQKSTAWDIYYGDSALSEYSGNTAKANAVANTPVSGVTMSNGYWDSVHKTIMGYGDNSTSADHVQTYDYGDFYKIFNEKKPVDNIVFDFKYRTTTHNLVTNAPSSPTPSNLTSTYKNGFELLTNFHGRNVDLFGDPLSGDAADPSKTKPLYVVSIGGVNDNVSGVENIAGYYATEWKVFAPNSTTGTPASSDAYKLVSNGDKNSIPPEVLVLNNNSTSFNNTTYPSADANHVLTNWQDLYTALEAYRGRPVMISYEAADAQQGQGLYYTGTGGATRNDGRWLYSKNGENITSTIKIQYSDDNGASYTDLNTTSPQVTGLSAYFTNDGVEGQMTYSTTIDPDKTFDFEAKTTNANYKFVGWFMEDGTKITTDNASHTERSGSYTFVAKFMQVQSGQLILSHSADKGTISGTDYQGAGTAKISAVVKNGDEVVRTYDLTTSDITLDDKIIKSDSAYTIEVTLEATATGQDTLGTTVLANPSGQDLTYFNAASTTTEGKTKTIVLNSFTVANLFSGTTQNVKSINYHSYFTKTVFNYKFKFEAPVRGGGTKNYYREGTLTSAQADKYVIVGDVVSPSGIHARFLDSKFIETIAPHISNFNLGDYSWHYAEKYQFNGPDSGVWTISSTAIPASTPSKKTLTATFSLPYSHSNGVPTETVPDEATSVNLEINNISFNTVIKNNESYVTAPKKIKNGTTEKIFQYWSVRTSKNNEIEVARCYFVSFNLVAFDNYYIVPVYGTTASNISGSGIQSSVTYLETTRNQWNTDGNDSAKNEMGDDGLRKAGDLLYNDFVLSYNYNGVAIYNNDEESAAITQLGFVVERVQALDIQNDGTPYTDPSHYKAKNNATTEQIKEYIKNNTLPAGMASSMISKQAINKNALDNKNRIEIYDAFYNTAGWDNSTQTPTSKFVAKNYVYKIYTYMIINGTVELCETPAYFTMYAEATK